MIRFSVGAVSDVGRRRTVNEDCALVSERVVAVADGMGGHVGGEIASAVAIEALRVAMIDPEVRSLPEAVAQANAAVWDRGAEAELRGMGTTMCALALVEVEPEPAGGEADDGAPTTRLAMTNVGDSRIYRLTGGELERLTVDHSLVEGLVREGRISADEAARHPQRNVVTRVLGMAEVVEVDDWQLEPEVGDRYLLASDGLFNEVDDARIGATLRRLADPQEAAHELVSLANQGGGRDNITVVVVDLVDDDGEVADSFGDRVIRPRVRVRDVAGFTAATPVGDGDPGIGDADERSMLPPVVDSERVWSSPWLTWRTGIFVLLVVAVFAVAGLTVAWYGQNGYFVSVDEATGEVAVFKGRPGGLLWYDPTLVESTGVQLSRLTPVLRERIEAVPEFASFDEAAAYLANVAEQLRASTSTTTTPSTTTTSTSTTSTPSASP